MYAQSSQAQVVHVISSPKLRGIEKQNKYQQAGGERERGGLKWAGNPSNTCMYILSLLHIVPEFVHGEQSLRKASGNGQHSYP